MEFDSYGLYREQEKKSVARKMTEEEKMVSPFISLADKVSLQDVEPAVKAHKKLLDFRKRTGNAMPAEPPESEQAGSVRIVRDEKAVSKQYISATSGFDIVSLEKDLLGKWRYQRFNGEDTDEMTRLKGSLSELTTMISSEASFDSVESVKTLSRQIQDKYVSLIRSCETYLEGHKRPMSIAGISRRSMAEKLLQAAKAELEMVEDSAINCYTQARETASGTGGVKLTWDEILHRGRLRNIDKRADEKTGQKPANDPDQKIWYSPMGFANAAMIMHGEDQQEREQLTFATSAEELKECHRVVAMSRLAEKLGCGELAGGGSMNTRMTTMIIDGRAVTGVITSGIVKRSLSDATSARELDRPGFSQSRVQTPGAVYGAEYVQGLMNMALLDYLSGVGVRDSKDFACDREEHSTSTVLRGIQASPHLIASKAFGKATGDAPDLKDTWMDPDMAEKILQMDGEALTKMFKGVLEDDEIAFAITRLEKLKASIESAAGAAVVKTGGQVSLDRSRLPKTFKDKAELERVLSTPGELSAYASKKDDPVAKLMDKDIVTSTESVKELPVTQEGNLAPLDKLASAVGKSMGKNADVLEAIKGDFLQRISGFVQARQAKVDFSKGKDDVLRSIDDQLTAIAELRSICRNYLKNSTADEDVENRFAMGRILYAADEQAKLYRKHAGEVCDWYEKNKQRNAEWTLSLSYEDLYREALNRAEDIGSGGYSPEGLYRGVDFAMSEICDRTDTPSPDRMWATLNGSIGRVEKNSDKVKELRTALEKIMLDRTLLVNAAGIATFKSHFEELAAKAKAYRKKQSTGKRALTKGSLSDEGEIRMEVLDDVESFIQTELSAFISVNEEGKAVLDRDALSSLQESCAYGEKKLGQVTFYDIMIEIKKKSLVAGEKFELAVARLKKEKKAGADKGHIREASDKEKDLSKKLSKKEGIGSLHALSEDLTLKLKNRKSNSAQITTYERRLRTLVELKDRPVFSKKEVAAFKGDFKKQTEYGSRLVSRFNEMAEMFNLLTDAHNQYMQKQADRFFGGVLSGSSRMDIVKKTYATYQWEFSRFLGKTAYGETRILPENLISAVEDLMKGGLSLDKITLTDITNQARVKAIPEGGKKK